MHAVILTGGKQYRVAEGDVIRVEKIPGDVGDTIKLGDVLTVGEGEEIKVGDPYLEGAEVLAKILRQGKGKKIIVFKKKKRKGYSRKAGHRQQVTEISIEEIRPEKKVAKRTKKSEAEEVKKEAKKEVEEKPEKKVKKEAKKEVKKEAKKETKKEVKEEAATEAPKEVSE